MHIYRSPYSVDTHHIAYDNAMRTQTKLASEPSKTPPAVLKTTFAPIHPINQQKEPQ